MAGLLAFLSKWFRSIRGANSPADHGIRRGDVAEATNGHLEHGHSGLAPAVPRLRVENTRPSKVADTTRRRAGEAEQVPVDGGIIDNTAATTRGEASGSRGEQAGGEEFDISDSAAEVAEQGSPEPGNELLDDASRANKARHWYVLRPFEKARGPMVLADLQRDCREAESHQGWKVRRGRKGSWVTLVDAEHVHPEIGVGQAFSLRTHADADRAARSRVMAEWPRSAIICVACRVKLNYPPNLVPDRPMCGRCADRPYMEARERKQRLEAEERRQHEAELDELRFFLSREGRDYTRFANSYRAYYQKRRKVPIEVLLDNLSWLNKGIIERIRQEVMKDPAEVSDEAIDILDRRNLEEERVVRADGDKAFRAAYRKFYERWGSSPRLDQIERGIDRAERQIHRRHHEALAQFMTYKPCSQCGGTGRKEGSVGLIQGVRNICYSCSGTGNANHVPRPRD